MSLARAVAPPLDHVSLAQIDRCGRGLIADRALRGGGRVVIWVE